MINCPTLVEHQQQKQKTAYNGKKPLIIFLNEEKVQ